MVRVKIPALIELARALNHVTVTELRELPMANAIVNGQIRQTDEGFILTLKLSWGKDNAFYSTRHKRPNTWKS